MDVVLFLFIGGGAIWGGLALVRFQGRQQQAVASKRIAGLLQHRRSGDYPSSCSWCKNTALAKKLFVFRRSDGVWKSEDVIARLSFQSDRIENVEAFRSCEYCSVRFPMSIVRCPNCGAARFER
jgi:hypothetical protein